MTGLGRARAEEVMTVVGAMHGLSKGDLRQKTQRHAISHPRQKAMYLARELTGQSYPQLGRAFGGLDHTSVLFGVRKIAARVAGDEKLAAELNVCRARIAELVAERMGRMVLAQGSSSDWSPPPPAIGMALSKPSTVVASIDEAAWSAVRVAA